MSDEQAVRRAALALLIVVAPFLLLGAVLTISLIGAYFGLPLLLVTVPPAMVAWRVRTAPSDSVQLGRFAIASTLVASALTLTTIATAAGGLDDPLSIHHSSGDCSLWQSHGLQQPGGSRDELEHSVPPGRQATHINEPIQQSNPAGIDTFAFGQVRGHAHRDDCH